LELKPQGVARDEAPGQDRRHEVVGPKGMHLRLQADKVSLDVALEGVILPEAILLLEISCSPDPLPWLWYGLAGRPTTHILPLEVAGIVTRMILHLTSSQRKDPLRSIAVCHRISTENKFLIASDDRF